MSLGKDHVKDSLRPRVLVISGLALWNYGPRWEIFSRFFRHGYKVDYVSPFNEEKVEGIFAHKLNIPLFEKMSGRLLLWFLFMVFSFGKALKIAKKTRPDIIYGYEIFGALPAYFLSRIFRTPLITRFQGAILYPHLGKKSLLLFFHHILAFKVPADFLIIDNDGTYGDQVARCLRVPGKRIKFWMLGVNKDMHPTINSLILKERLGLYQNAKIILSIGRLASWKRVDRLIEAVPHVVEKRKDVFFVIAGEGSEKAKLKHLARKLNVSNHVDFVGHVSYENIPNFLAIADIFVTLQDLTCLSANLMEAMAYGKCVLALDAGDVKKVLKNGENGVLLEYSQLKLLPKVLLELTGNDAYRTKLGRKAKDYAAKNFWTWDERADKEISLVEELLIRKDG
jgi:glycosyltransferase involved in cell wall biosynthesis